jgi:hypothetical protein
MISILGFLKVRIIGVQPIILSEFRLLQKPFI